MKRFACGIVMVVTFGVQPAWAQFLSCPLPANEKEAAFMLRDGTLDSVTWQKVRPYYDQPIMVPLGELNYLIDFFPDNAQSLPTSAEELAPYGPWSKPDVDRFFEDYPELSLMKPILSFQITGRPTHARIGCSLTHYNDSTPIFSSQFSWYKNKTLIIQGETRFLNNSARWGRRSACAKFAGAGTLTIGNYDLDVDHGLFTGIRRVKTTDTGVALNWLNGESNGFNGIVYEGTIGNMLRTDAFYHYRTGEVVYGAGSSVGLGRCVRFIAGASRFNAGPQTKMMTSAHAGLTLATHSWKAGVFTAVRQDHHHSIPISVYVKHSREEAGIDLSYSHVPASCNTGLSAVGEVCSEKISNNDSLPGDANAVSLQCRMPLWFTLHSSCGVSYYYTAGKAASESFVLLSAAGWMDSELRYSYRMSTARPLDNQSMAASADKRLSRIVKVKLTSRLAFVQGAFQSARARLTAAIASSTNTEIAPFLAMYGWAGNSREISMGLTHTLHFVERMWSELQLEIPVVVTFPEHWMVHAKASFTF